MPRWRSRPYLVFCFVALVPPALFSSAGCVSPSRTSSAGRTDTAAVQKSAEYQSARSRFQAADYSAALARVEVLLRRPDLTPDAQAYLHHQRDICKAALAGRPDPHALPPTPPASAPRVRTVADADCGPRALFALCQREHVPCPDLASLRQIAATTADGTSMAGMAKAARATGFAKAKGVQMDLDALSHLSSPALAWVDGNHYVAVLAVNERREQATILDPNTGLPGKEENIALSDLLARSGGILLTLERPSSSE